MTRWRFIVLYAAFFSMVSAASHAQICREPGADSSVEPPEGKVFIDCDMRYRDLSVTCDTEPQRDVNRELIRDDKGNLLLELLADPWTGALKTYGDGKPRLKPPGTRAPCPPKPMPMKRTPLASYIWDYSPYLFASPRNPTDPTQGYSGINYVGTESDPSKVKSVIDDNSEDSRVKIATCVAQIRLPRNPQNVAEEAARQRLQLDNCTNQYILQDAIHPFTKSNAKEIDNPEVSTNPIDLETECQPLRTFKDDDNEYKVSDYLKVAWQKSLINANHRKNMRVDVPGFVKTIVEVAGALFDEVPLSLLDNIVNSPEPGYPRGVTLENPIAMPQIPDIYPSNLSSIDFERIVDPTHPFSPRWDYLVNDRDYYSWYNALYTKKPANSTFCAGVREAPKDAKAEEKDDLEVKVDVLSFRKKRFEDGFFRRAAFNAICYKDKTAYNVNMWTAIFSPVYDIPFVPDIAKGAFCLDITADQIATCIASFGSDCRATRIACFECFKLKYNEKISQEQGAPNKSPPCAVNYLDKDLEMEGAIGIPGNLLDVMKQDMVHSGERIRQLDAQANSPHVKDEDRDAAANERDRLKAIMEEFGDMLMDAIKQLGTGKIRVVGALNSFNTMATCNHPYAFKRVTPMAELCRDIRRPFTPMNILKMRYHNPNDKDNIVFKDGVPEGYAFKNFFGNRMPYPRLWDTGFPLMKTTVVDSNYQPPDDTTGQFTTIVGVGREAAPDSLQEPKINNKKPAERHFDERCKTGGWTNRKDIKKIKFAGSEMTLPDPMTSWTELKAYQANTMRYKGLSCLGRYEKAFKPGGTEAVATRRASGAWPELIITACNRENEKDCVYYTLAQYTARGGKDFLKELKKKAIIKVEERLALWNNPWMGYVSDIGRPEMFPSFGKFAALDIGAENAMPGDLLILPYGGGKFVDGFVPGGGSIMGQVQGIVGTLQGFGLDLSALGVSGRPALPQVAFVVRANNKKNMKDCEKYKVCHLVVEIGDGGKLPDVCGTTDLFFQSRRREFYKPGHLPQSAVDEFKLMQWTSTCEDPKLSRCEFLDWKDVEIYRPMKQRREGCKKINANLCGENEEKK